MGHLDGMSLQVVSVTNINCYSSRRKRSRRGKAYLMLLYSPCS